MKAEFEASMPRTVVENLVYPAGIAIDSTTSRLVWADCFGDKIQSSDLNGQDLRTLASLPRYTWPWAVAVSNGRLFWSDVM